MISYLHRKYQTMRRPLLLLILIINCTLIMAQPSTIKSYTQKTYMVPMRDGVKLYTVVLSPVGATASLPILIERTPYGADLPEDVDLTHWPYLGAMAKEGYIFVFQDIRGKYKSEGTMQIHQPLIHAVRKGAIDESTDTYDTVDWLIKNISNNNGKAGIVGISYPGWLALVGAVDPHPALKASSEQACMSDLFLGDDFHHNGAFRLSYGMEYTYMVEHAKNTSSNFPFPQFDTYNWYLQLGSLKNVNDKYFHNTIPTWNNFVAHPNYDTFWQKNSTLSYIQYPQIPMLHVGGYYDQEDLNGPQLMYTHMEKKDSSNHNYIVLGPWRHGGWAGSKGDSLGKISFENETAPYFHNLQKQWFDYWLKGKGDGKFAEATCFQTGTNSWKTYSSWPPKEADTRKLYTHADGTCSFDKLNSTDGSVSYISDPANPVPYRMLPIEATYGEGSRWYPWQVEDQRFVIPDRM